MLSRVVSERRHVGGLVIRLVRIEPDIFFVSADDDDTGTWWPTFNAASVDDARRYVDGVLLAGPHDCVALGCPRWVDASR